MCWQCKSKEGSLTSACGNCKNVIENNSDFDIGPQDRDECYFARLVSMDVASSKPMFCGCDAPSYDPLKEESEEEEDLEEEYDAPRIIGQTF